MERAKVIFAYTSEQEDELSIQVYCLTPSPPPHPHTSHPHTSHLTPHTLTISHCHTPTLPHPHTVTPPHCHTPTLSHPHTATHPHCHTLTLSHPHTATPPHPHTITPQPGALTSLFLHSYSFNICYIPLHTVPLTSHTSPSHLMFQAGEILEVVDKKEHGWWKVRVCACFLCGRERGAWMVEGMCVCVCACVFVVWEGERSMDGGRCRCVCV